ncbi:MAG TPA: glycoside hydrolase domain-containing protein, partial [Sediminibacterium sp.]|nr:glycoside hydrolase domain-containing protein [Sediminibacterium sp.]
MKKILLPLVFGGCLQLAEAQQIPYLNTHDYWNADSLGNHRAVIRVSRSGDFVSVNIPWRRRDTNPQDKRIIVTDSVHNRLIKNAEAFDITQESGTIRFQPVSGPGLYYVYYLPYRNEGRSNYPKGVYLKPANTADAQWLNQRNTGKQGTATVVAFESVNAFNSFFPMEIIATTKETDSLVSASHHSDYLVFPEDRSFPVKMTDHLPQRWIQKGSTSVFRGIASRGEFYSFQLAVYALQELRNVQVHFSDLKSSEGSFITADSLSCINTTGTDYAGHPFTQTLSVPAGSIQSLWCLLTVPKKTPPGIYQGNAIIHADGLPDRKVRISLRVNAIIAADGNISEPWNQTRLHWLNSTLAQENTVIPPYTPLKLVHDTSIQLLGREVILNAEGFPKQIRCFFTPEMTGFSNEPTPLLYEGIHFHFTGRNGKNLILKNREHHFSLQTPGTIQWESSSSNDSIVMQVKASLEFDGFMSYTVKVTALQDIDLKDITMHIPFRKEVADYLMGLGQKGGQRPDLVDWKWDVAHKNQDGAWIGTVNAGLQYSLRDEHYVRPLNTNFYLQKPLLLPSSWGNNNKGGITVGIKGASMLANNYSGERSMHAGDSLFYNFTLLITPFHPIQTEFQWANRFYHKYNNLDTIQATGATIINIHHATPINPWINYPFIEYQKMKSYISDAHSRGLKVKIYNTIRELSNRAYELFPMRSLGHEIYSPGKGGGFSWLQEHVGSDYIPAWFVPEIKDAALVNSGMSRWHNYYVEGMNWLVNHVGIDGLYLDDVAFDRTTMKRVKRVLTQNGHPGIIDLHSANQYNKNDGFNNSANLYMEHFPYLNRLWFGEYFDYENNGPDFFLTEVSGIPFGL